MCGLVTVLTGREQRVPMSALRMMTDEIEHRGPDDCAYAHVDGRSGSVRTWSPPQSGEDAMSGVLFGFRRLSIIDLTDTGRQPMVSDDGVSVLAFNGEIYNFVELRAELQAQGVRFHGRSDSEVLLRAYERWDTGCFEKLNGMWAITLWDGRRRRLVASRDRFGVKPLYYTRVDGAWLLASEIKSLLRYRRGAWAVNDRAVFEYLAYGMIDHRTETSFHDVHAVAPGTWLEFGATEPVEHRFWSLSAEGPAGTRSDRELIEEFGELFGDAVRLRVRSDVPIGTMLSGGLDSASITALISEQRERGGGASEELEAVRTFHHAFTACWPGWQGDEELDVDRIGQRFGLSVHKAYLDGELLRDSLPAVVHHLDEPFMTPVCLVDFELMKMAREQGVKVVLNGHASDEILGGYADMFVAPYLADLVRRGRLGRAVREFRGFKGQAPDALSGVLRELAGDDTMVRTAMRALLSFRAQPSVFSPDFERRYPYAEAIDVRSLPTNRGRFQRALGQKFFREFVPQWLRMEDRMSMAASVEARLPFMDYRLVEFAFRLPDDLKLREGWTKYVLRQAMEDRLPLETLTHRHKRQFSTPHAQWFRSSWRKTIEEFLLVDSPYLDRYVDVPLFRHKLRAWLDGDDSAMTANLVWRAVSTESWFRIVVTGEGS